MRSPEEMRAHIIGKATEDETFRGKLLSDPRTSIEDELGITIPEGVAVEVHENTMQKVHLVLPLATKLSDEDLKAASAGDASTASGGGGPCY